jgi:hypothetical protein
MNSSLRQHVTVLIAAALGVMIGSVGPGVAQAAYDAVNADKVDGKHAVGSAATVTQRKGKLVATNPTTGLLPNGIIAKAPDSAKLNGFTHEALRSIPLSIQGTYLGGAANHTASGVSLPAAGASVLVISFIIPPDHTPNAKMWVDMTFAEASVGACALYLDTNSTFGAVGFGYLGGGWGFVEGEPFTFAGPMQVAAGPEDLHLQSVAWPFTGNPGDFVEFRMVRGGDVPADTCGEVTATGLQLRY